MAVPVTGDVTAERLLIAAGDDSGPAGYPRALVEPSGRIVVGYVRGAGWNYFVGGSWTVIASTDLGRTWQSCRDPEVPLNWPGSSAREQHDRATGTLEDGTRWTAGVVGWVEQDESVAATAVEQGHYVTPDPLPGRPGRIGVGTDRVFLQTAAPGGRWQRREWNLTAAGWTLGQHREVMMDDGTVLLPARQRSHDGQRGRFLTVGITPEPPGTIRIHELPRDLAGRTGSESALARLGGDRLLMLMRADVTRGGSGRLLASWSEDAGRSWTVPVETEIAGRPPHLLRLTDGRLLVSYGHQEPPHGVWAAVSEDDGRTWGPPLLVAADTTRSPSDEPIGYHPMTVELAGGELFSCFYVRRGDTTDAVAARWRLPE